MTPGIADPLVLEPMGFRIWDEPTPTSAGLQNDVQNGSPTARPKPPPVFRSPADMSQMQRNGLQVRVEASMRHYSPFAVLGTPLTFMMEHNRHTFEAYPGHSNRLYIYVPSIWARSAHRPIRLSPKAAGGHSRARFESNTVMVLVDPHARC
jgi:hypothetical protein